MNEPRELVAAKGEAMMTTFPARHAPRARMTNFGSRVYEAESLEPSDKLVRFGTTHAQH